MSFRIFAALLKKGQILAFCFADISFFLKHLRKSQPAR
jgi:hypothetical protein